MWEHLLAFAGGGIVFLLLYLIISNTLWLLFGSRVIQFLPGVDIHGPRGTVKIAAMLILAFFGTVIWFVKYIFGILPSTKQKPVFKDQVALSIQKGSRWVHRRSLLITK